MDVLVAAAAPVVRLPKVTSFARLLSWVVLVALATLCGASWSWGKAGAMSPLVMVAWWRAETRLQAMVVGAAYQLGATCGLASAAALWLELPLVVSAALIVGAAFAVGACWSVVVPARCTALQSAVAAVLLWAAITVCPIGAGALMVGHPLAAAGWWCPGAGWAGLLVMLALFVGARTRVGSLLMVVWAPVAVVMGSTPRTAPGVGVVNTESKPSRGEFDFLAQYRVAHNALDLAELEHAKVVVLPEGAAGTWTDPMREVWAPYSARLDREGRSALVGAVLQGTGARLENVVVGLGRLEGRIVHQRLPIPIAMWRPWDEESFEARPWEAGVLEFNGVRTGVLVCWEGALVWPALRSMAAGAESLVLVANHGWTGPRVETRRGLEAWGALFDVPVAMAENVWRNQ